MVSNQQVMRVQRPVRIATCSLAVLGLLGGCQMFQGHTEAPVAAAPVAQRSAPASVVQQDNAIEVAIANAPADSAASEAAPAPTSGPVLNPSAPKSYTVKRGDTLWDISAMYLRDPWLWPEIWHVNPNVQNPHLIYPGDVLTLAYGANGQPQVMVTQGSALRVHPLVRSTPLDGPVATIPFEAIAAFLGKPSIVSKEDVKNGPHVAALGDRHIVAGVGHEVYVKGLQDKGPGRYSVVHIGEELKDPETGKVLGYIGAYTGAAKVDAVDTVSRATLIESTRETNAGDLLFAEDTHSVSTDIVPRAPPAGLNGQIMAVVDGVSLIGQFHVVAINRGSKHGLETGHVLAIDRQGEVIPDASCKQRSAMAWCFGKNLKLPDERAGTLLVFKTYDDMSFGLIVSTTVPVAVADRVRTP
jgi:LysM repeat protein